jgi:RNA polymerase sigma-54 factor
MTIRTRLELRQGTQLVMTPQLQQSIKLLQLGHLDLLDVVAQELGDNPLLTTPDEGAPSEHEGADEDAFTDNYDAAGESASATDGPADEAGNGEGEDTAALAERFDDWEAPVRGEAAEEGPANRLEQTLSKPETLRGHLVDQLNLDITDPIDRLIGLALIDMLDDCGYLVGATAGIAERLNCAPERVDAVLARLRQFDPAGLFARDLADCLALQLAERNRLDPAMAALLDNLDRLAAGDHDGLLRRCAVEAEDLAEMIQEIRALDPKPAQAFEAEIAQPVVPDVFVRPTPDDGWKVELNSETLPRVLVDREYHAEVSRAVRTEAEREYLAERLSQATWLVKSLDQRARTVLKISREIVRQQRGFLVHGVQQLRPLVLRDIADAIEMHESTVSRVVNNKYMATPRGIVELRYFFSASLSSSTGGEAVSAEAVRERVKRLIEQEDPAHPLSDDRLAELLRLAGIDIARRTVAKYRESLRIPSSMSRRRLKKQAAFGA